MNNNCDKYENLCDILEYGGISNEEAITICNNIIAGSISENENSVLEAIFHAVFTGVVSRQIGKEIHTDIIIKNLDKFNEEVLDYIITILAYTGNKEYAKIIRHIGEKYKNLDINDALTELDSRINENAMEEDE